MLTEALEVYLADFSVSATWSSPTAGAVADVIFDQPDSNVLGRRAQSIGYRITFRATSFPGIAYGDFVTVSGRYFRVLEVSSLDDGAFFDATLERL